MTRINGLSLVELIVVLALVAILATATLPSFAPLLDRYRLEVGVQAMTRALALARSEAIKRGGRVSMLNPEGRWERGWLVFADDNGNGMREDNETELYVQPPMARITIRGNSTVHSLMTYAGDGTSVLPNGAFQAGSLHICAESVDTAGYRIVISRGGRTRVEKMAPCTDPPP